ncbi:MAG: hypothetical protein P1U65_02955 [Minwuia sp.]|nr:hypothetical protein [Minwuia sp.]
MLDWTSLLPIGLFLAAQVIGAVIWAATFEAKVASMSAQLEARIVALEANVADNATIRRRMWDRIERLDRTSTTVDERTRIMAEQLTRIYQQLIRVQQDQND